MTEKIDQTEAHLKLKCFAKCIVVPRWTVSTFQADDNIIVLLFIYFIVYVF